MFRAGLAAHCEICKYYHTTSKEHAEVLQNLLVLHLHSDAGPSRAVQAAAQDVHQGCIGQRRHLNAVPRVRDCMHLLDEGEGREWCVPVRHLEQDASQAPDVRRPSNLLRL